MKDMERNFRESAQANKALLERVDELSKSNVERTADTIKANIKAAAEAGEFDKLATLTEELVKVTSGSAATKPSKADPAPKSEQEPKSNPDLSEFASVDEEAALRRWAMEKDGEGNFVRPWLHPDHPKSKRAQSLIQAVIADPELATAEAKMAEVDRLMGTAKTPSPAAVLSPTITGNRGSPTKAPKATREQMAVAEEMGVPIDKYMAIVAQSPKDAQGRMQMSYKANWK